jgi:predicted ATPase
MKELTAIRLVQFFLYEKQDVTLGRTCGIFGANGSGKSSLLDAVQIVMFGASAERGRGVAAHHPRLLSGPVRRRRGRPGARQRNDLRHAGVEG